MRPCRPSAMHLLYHIFTRKFHPHLSLNAAGPRDRREAGGAAQRHSLQHAHDGNVENEKAWVRSPACGNALSCWKASLSFTLQIRSTAYCERLQKPDGAT